MKQLLLAICMLAIGAVNAQITNNVELFGNSDFSDANLFTNGPSNFAANASTDASIRGKWYAGATEVTSYNVDGFMNNIGNGYFDAFVPFDAALVYNNFLAQVPDMQFTTGRYRLSLKAKGTAPFYIKISSVAAMGTELGSILRNPSSAAIVKQTTHDYNTYSIKITPTEEWVTYSADLDISLNTNYVRVFIVFPKTGVISLDDVSIKRTKDLPTTYYIRPSANTTAWSNLAGIEPEQIVSADAFTFAGTNTYYLTGGNYTTGGTIALTTGKIYGGFSGNETSIDLEARPTSDLDQNGIVEPWEFTNITSITSTLANSKFDQTGTTSRLLTVVGGEVDGVTFTDHNYLTFGGAIVLGQINGNPTINTPEVAGKMTRCTVKKMKGGTGVIMVTNNMSVIDRCLIEDNTGTVSFGAVYLNRFGGIVSNSVIRNNQAKTKGGAIYAGNVLATGGVDLKAVVSNCVIYNNTAEQNGGAIVGVAGVGLSGLEIVNTTIVNNKTIAPGVASVEIENNGLLVNSIVINDPLDELSVNNVSNYIESVAYGTLTSASAVLYPALNNVTGKAIADYKFVNPTNTQGYLGLSGADYDAMRKANYKISDITSAAYVSNATIPTSYLVGGSGASITTRATVPTTDILGLTRSTNMTIGAYFYNPASGLNAKPTDKVFAFGSKDAIYIQGEQGNLVSIYSVSGQLVSSLKMNAEKIIIPSAKGFYVVVLGNQTNKVVVD